MLLTQISRFWIDSNFKISNWVKFPDFQWTKFVKLLLTEISRFQIDPDYWPIRWELKNYWNRGRLNNYWRKLLNCWELNNCHRDLLRSLFSCQTVPLSICSNSNPALWKCEIMSKKKKFINLVQKIHLFASLQIQPSWKRWKHEKWSKTAWHFLYLLHFKFNVKKYSSRCFDGIQKTPPLPKYSFSRMIGYKFKKYGFRELGYIWHWQKQ